MRRHHPAKWRLRKKRGISILLTRRFPDLGSASDWSKEIFSQSEAQPRSWKCHVISMEFSRSFLDQKSFRGETSGGVGKRRVFCRLGMMARFVFLWSVSLARFSKKLRRKWILKKMSMLVKLGCWLTFIDVYFLLDVYLLLNNILLLTGEVSA